MRSDRFLKSSVRVNKTCLNEGHDWDVFGHPNFVCSRPGCHVRASHYDAADQDHALLDAYVPVSAR